MKRKKPKTAAKPLTPLRLRLCDYLRDHDRYQIANKTLPEVIGDGFLYHTNTIYRSIRDATLGLGYRFSDRPDFNYASYPLIHLRSILETKTIPYVNNLSGLRTLETWRPRRFRIADLYHLVPEENHLFHESAHCVAHSMIDLSTFAGANKRRSQIIKIMLGESFANATELIGFQQSQDRWLAQLNMYVHDEIVNFNEFERQLGIKAAFKITLGLYLYANFLCTEISVKEEQLVFELAEIPSRIRRDRAFKAVFKRLKFCALDLNNAFRVNTTSLYLKISNLDADIEKLLAFDPVEFILARPSLVSQVDSLCALFESSTSGDLHD